MSCDYALLDSGALRKLERFGNRLLIRPAFQAIWRVHNPELWQRADAIFSRGEGQGSWKGKQLNPESWEVEIEKMRFHLKMTPFGHLGVFPEHALLWNWIREKIASRKEKVKVLNLFAYSGGATLAAAAAGAQVTHLDAAKGMVSWAKENALLNHLENHPIRWIVDDVTKFLIREKKRGVYYDAIIMDPPTFGRGAMGEVFKIEKDLFTLFDLSLALLSKNPLFFLFSTHTPGYTPVVLEQLFMSLNLKKVQTGELILKGKPFSIPAGSFAAWIN